MNNDRWPPIYDADQLKETIKKLCKEDNVFKYFYASDGLGKARKPYQGDVIRFLSPVPVIDSDGELSGYGEFSDWLVIGNTCDIDRDIKDVEYSQIVPIAHISSKNIRPERKEQFLSYKYSRQFFLPSWSSENEGYVSFADFTLPVSIHKDALFNKTTIQVQMTRIGWMLLHSCLVRFLARDDGRAD